MSLTVVNSLRCSRAALVVRPYTRLLSGGMERLYVVTLFLLLATFSGAQLQSSVERPCPGERVTFTCTVPSVGHEWEIPSLNISRALLRRNKNKVFSDSPFQFAVTEVRTGSITSTAAVNATEDLNGTLVMCQDGFKIHPSQKSTINIIAPPAAPETPSVMISDSRQEFIVKWDEPPLSMGETVDTYFVNISGPSALCGSADKLQQVNVRNYTCLIKTEPQEDETVIIRVQAANCGGNLIGPESEPVSVSLQAPPIVTSRPTTTHPTSTHPTATPSISTGYIDSLASIILANLHVVLGMTFAFAMLVYEHCCRTDAEKDSMYSTVRRILIIVISCLTVVGIPLAIVLILFYMYSHKTGKKVEDVSPNRDKPPTSFTDQQEENPVTGDIRTTPTKRKKIHEPEDHLPTYRDPSTISHEATPTGELYTVPDKKKGAKQKQQASRPSEEQLAGMYSQARKIGKQHSQGPSFSEPDDTTGEAPDSSS